ncbi:hypothetical protein AB0K60_18575 [Thermopolyspora sp. NPDC052614]|uniref:hypothetical protein n=1 Tax=Thermopolyspora sp. NPDC052614 TaxID=3155682 RepID=UPI003434C3C9
MSTPRHAYEETDVNSRWTGRVRLAAALAAVASLNLIAPAAAQASTARADGRCELTWANTRESDTLELTLLCLPANGGDSISSVDIWASDTFSDDLLLHYPVQCPSTSQYPVTKRIRWTVYSEYLDEDLLDSDEIYARVAVKKADGKTYVLQSNVAKGRWGKTIDLGFGPPKRKTLTC